MKIQKDWKFFVCLCKCLWFNKIISKIILRHIICETLLER